MDHTAAPGTPPPTAPGSASVGHRTAGLGALLARRHPFTARAGLVLAAVGAVLHLVAIVGRPLGPHRSRFAGVRDALLWWPVP